MSHAVTVVRIKFCLTGTASRGKQCSHGRGPAEKDCHHRTLCDGVPLQCVPLHSHLRPHDPQAGHGLRQGQGGPEPEGDQPETAAHAGGDSH